MRLEQLDALRGLALFGILIVNIFIFHAPYTHYSAFYGTFDGYQSLVLSIVLFLFGGKSMFIYAFLFGYSFRLQKVKANNDRAFQAYWRRRMIVLAVFGLLHVLLLSFGDILLPYAVLGLSLPWLSKLKNRWLLLIALLVNFVPVYEFMLRGLIEFPSVFMQPVYDLETYVDVNRNGSYWEVMKLRLSDYAAFRNEKLVRYIPKELSLFMLGIVMSRLSLASNPNPRYCIPFCLISLPLVAAIGIFEESLFSMFDFEQSMTQRLALGLIVHSCELLHGMLYVIGFFLIWKLAFAKRTLSLLQYPGRLSLTNYLIQSFVCLVFFSGLDLYGKLGPAELALMAIAIYLCQAVGSALWLRRYQFGPLEYLWRMLCKRKPPPRYSSAD
ncbi:MAG: DUF418 domain-containing protein [Planctomycetota bacterium]